MVYWVYENWVLNKALIHESACAWCKNGQGRKQQRRAGRDRGRWLGPFATVPVALQAARRSGCAEVQVCRKFHCIEAIKVAGAPPAK